MRYLKHLAIALLALAFTTGARAQTTSTAASAPTLSTSFSTNLQVLSVPALQQTAVATDLGGAYKLKPSFFVREDSILVPADNVTSYMGGFIYELPATWLKATGLPTTQFDPYLTASVGVDRYTPTGGVLQQHISVLAGGGLNYDPANMSHFSVNFEVRWAKLPGVANSTVLFSTGPVFTF